MKIKVVLIKPSKYGRDGYVERFRKGYLPNSTLSHMRCMTPDLVDGCEIVTRVVDEYVCTGLDYLDLLKADSGDPVIVALVGVQSHQLHRALDLAALAHSRGCQAILGGPHPMTCDTSMLQNRGISFSLAEAELVWGEILTDMARFKELRPVYGAEQRWADVLPAQIITPPSQQDLNRYLLRMVGLYPARGCPYDCNFCSITKLAGRRVRSQPTDATLESLRLAAKAGVRMIIFCSDNFNKYPFIRELLTAMIAERLPIGFFCQCDAQIEKDPELIELLARAGCFQIFVGTESFSRQTLKEIRKGHNHPECYEKIVELCNLFGITTHFSNIVGFLQEGEPQVLEHLERLKEIVPTMASFGILTPAPGTDQYADFLKQGLITEPNLDRFDGSVSVWDHPSISAVALERLVLHCYREFYTSKHLGRVLGNYNWRSGVRHNRNSMRDIAMIAAYTLFSRYSTARGYNPMSGGIRRIRIDHRDRYLSMRKNYFGYELVPLPDNLSLTPREQKLNTLLNPASIAHA